jgi:uncharacterized protein
MISENNIIVYLGKKVRSTSLWRAGATPPDWRAAGLRYFGLNWFFRAAFGHRVWKLSVDGGLGCPNRLPAATGPCVFCNIESFSPSRREQGGTVAGQIAVAARQLQARHRADQFLAYFQPATNTFAPVAQLRSLFEEAIAQPGIVGLVIGTRPDAVSNEVLDLLAELSTRTWLLVEYGLQSIHDRSLQWLNRGHDYATFVDAVRRCQERGLACGAHVILGIPGESRNEMLATAREFGRLGLHTVKLHNLYAARETRLADLVTAGQVTLATREEYVGYVVDFLEVLSPDCVIDRLASSVSSVYLVAPPWAANSSAIRAAIDAELASRDTWQGRKA